MNKIKPYHLTPAPGVKYVAVDTWYDRASRNWITQQLDVEGNQVGDAILTGNRADANAAHETMRHRMLDAKL